VANGIPKIDINRPNIDDFASAGPQHIRMGRLRAKKGAG
jgi:hypothetical protein